MIIHQLGDGSTDSYNQRGGRPKTQCDKDLDSVPAQQSPQRKTDSDVGSGTYFPGEGQKIVAEDLQHKEVVGDLLYTAGGDATAEHSRTSFVCMRSCVRRCIKVVCPGQLGALSVFNGDYQ